MSKSKQQGTDFQLEGFWLHLVRGAWTGFLLIEVLVLISTLLATHQQGFVLCPITVSCALTPATAQALHRLSITPTNYATYNLVLALLQCLVFFSVGGFIFWRKSSQPVALVASFTLVNFAVWSFYPITTYPPEVILSNIYGLCVFTSLGYFLVTFPDGRFAPRWSRLLVVLWLVQALLFEIPGPFNITLWPRPLFAAEEVLTYGGTLAILIYRYLRLYSSSQRQQAKWLLFGFGALLVLIILYDLIGSLVPGLGAPDSFYQLANGTLTTITFLLVPLSIAMAILRFRLWDIDVLIRRTLVYTTLTVILALIYVGLVVIFGFLLRAFLGQQQKPLIIVASTLVIAALFQPLRHSIQRVIDRRFYRRKYNAARTMEAFSATLRQEVDLARLSEHLVIVVQETMQPASLSLWIRSVKQLASRGGSKGEALSYGGERPSADRPDLR